MRKNATIPLVVSTLLSAGALYLAFRNVPFGQLLAYVGEIDYWWIFPSTGLLLLSFALRVVRWRLILENSIRVGFWHAFHPLMIGFMMNCVLPARIGEVARPAILKKSHGLPMATGLATVAAERVFDVVMLITLFALTFSSITAQPELERHYFGLQLNSETLVAVAYGMIRVSIALLVFIALLTIGPSRRWIKAVITGLGRRLSNGVPKAKLLIQRIVSILINIIDNFSIGLSMVKQPAKLAACGMLTVLIWGTNLSAYIVFARGCPGIDLTWLQLTTVMVIICFFIALPSVPGFWGLWEAAGVFALSLYGVMEKEALGFTLVNHAAQLFPVIATGLVSTLITGANIMQLSRDNSPIPVPGPSSKGA